MRTIETVNTGTGAKGTTRLYETAEEAVMAAAPVGDYYEHVAEYDGGYIVVKRVVVPGQSVAAPMMPADESGLGATLDATARRKALEGRAG